MPLCIFTDGRSKQLRHKLDALGITDYFSEIIIYEEISTSKPNIKNFKFFEIVFGNGQYYYIQDNITKDFVIANKLNWRTICIKYIGLNIHSLNKSIQNRSYMSKHNVLSFDEFISLIGLDDR